MNTLDSRWKKAVFILVIVAFIASMGPRLFNTKTQNVATIAGIPITASELIRKARNFLSQQKKITSKQEKREIVDMLLSEIACEKLLDLETKSIGIYVDDEDIKYIILEEKFFYDKDG